MTTREMLHAIVDELPEADLVTAVRILKGLELSPDRLQIALANAPMDDEPDDDDFDGGLTEALAETEFISHDEVKRRLAKEAQRLTGTQDAGPDRTDSRRPACPHRSRESARPVPAWRK